MRVIGGSAKGKKLLSLPGESTRPILERVRTSLFDILRPDIEGIKVLDLFAGTGGIGIEALSQGAAFCVFVELNRAVVEIVKKNLSLTGLSEQAEVRSGDAFLYLKKTTREFDLVYIAPPQYGGLWVQTMHSIAERPDILSSGGQIIVQIDPKEYETLELTAFVEVDQRKYGNTLLVFYEKQRQD